MVALIRITGKLVVDRGQVPTGGFGSAKSRMRGHHGIGGRAGDSPGLTGQTILLHFQVIAFGYQR